MQFKLGTNTTLALFTGIAIFIWQAIIVTLGGEATDAMITAATTLILAALGVGVKSNDNKDDADESQHDKRK